MYIGVITHLLTIDPNFLGHPSKDRVSGEWKPPSFPDSMSGEAVDLSLTLGDSMMGGWSGSLTKIPKHTVLVKLIARDQKHDKKKRQKTQKRVVFWKGPMGPRKFQGNPGWWNIIIWPDTFGGQIITTTKSPPGKGIPQNGGEK